MLEKEETIENKKIGVGAVTVITMLAVCLVISGILLLLRTMGKNHLTTSLVDAAVQTDLGEADEGLDENQILYKGEKYRLNEDLITILMMGIDKETVVSVGGESWSVKEGSYYAGGQADALFLVVINPHSKEVNVVAINRNSMTDVDVWDEEGNYLGIYKLQISLQHGYGDGGTESCLKQVKTVSRMFHNIPITSYAAVSMDAIPELNDAVGGITVEVLDDIIYPEYDMDLHKGDIVTLYGEKAYWYVRLRNENIFDSNTLRLQRQKQYLTAFTSKAKEEAMSDIRVVINLYNALDKYMVTDIDLSSFTYLATELLDYQFDMDHIYTLEGETVMGEKYEEFYAEDAKLQEMIVELFYEKVE